MKKIFVSFAIKDRFARDNLVHKAKRQNVPFDFVDMSVRMPWDSQWKTRCRERIRECDGLIAFVSDNTINAETLGRGENKVTYWRDTVRRTYGRKAKHLVRKIFRFFRDNEEYIHILGFSSKNNKAA